ncbi:hypothetical protein M3Y94_00009400 [Aphelenchoides besseyi]|nr:hypothetical protein M3Y94_00009400 [Aphelenchoides besseyi]
MRASKQFTDTIRSLSFLKCNTKKSCPYCIIEADRGIKFVAAEEPVQQVDGKENVSSSLASTSANMTNENGGQSTSSSSYKTSTSLNNLPGSSRSCEQEPMDVNENERPQLSEEAMNQQEMFNKFQQAFDSLPAEHRAAIIGSFTVFKEASNLG